MKHLITTILLLSLAVSAQAQIDLSATFTGSPTAEDIEAVRLVIDNENERRAALTPPVDPLPSDTGAELSSSYRFILSALLNRAHADYRRQAKQAQLETNIKGLWNDASPAKRQAAINALKAP